ARMYITENASPKDMLKAEALLKKAAGQGYSKSQGLLGGMYELGAPGIKKNQKESVKWYTLAAEADEDVAQSRMGRMYYSGEYVTKDLKKAFELFREAAKQGNDEAIFYLGIMYYNGDGTDKNVEAAEALLKAAEERGYDAASVVLEAIKSGNDKIIIE
ncbi:MAG: sel1 repeat family protein, partial [Elusimicrobiales bacterium]|nr:sel1 repeat family protein [Elusimicrobiales bacterium]